jgi:hypothetical protein
MANTTGAGYGGGLRGGRAYELNTAGRVKGTSATVPYMGVALVGAKNLNLSIPKQRRLNHIDADRVAAADFLPPTEAASSNLTIAAKNIPLEAILTGNKARVIGEANSLGALTSNQGYEPLLGMYVYQESLDITSRLRRWNNILVARAKLIPMDGGFSDKESENNYDVLFTPSSTDLFGCTLTITADNETDEQYRTMMTEGLFALAAWIGDSYTDTFTFPVGYTPAKSAAKVAVYLNGVLQTAYEVTAGTTNIVFDTPPDANDDITVKWEY